MAVLGLAGLAHAAEPVPPLPGPTLRATNDLDGFYVTVGPVGSLTRVQDDWVTGGGGELSFLFIREHRFPAALGLAGGGVAYAARDGGRLWLEVEAALNEPLPLPLGLAVGLASEVDQTRPARLGTQATLWTQILGVVPFVRVGEVELAGQFVELGVMIKLPAWSPSPIVSR